MAKWIKSQPNKDAPYSEQKTAHLLSQLSDDWVIRWGFHYTDTKGERREGDFLVLGPNGGLMVLEAKEQLHLPYSPTGMWLGAEGSNPFLQLEAEWGAVKERVNELRRDRPMLFVMKALALPDNHIDSSISTFHDIPREFLIGRNDLDNFGKVWKQRAAYWGMKPNKKSRSIFFDAYGKGITPKAMKYFLGEAESIVLSQTEVNYEILDQLHYNKQFIFTGGMGTGKSWIAFELARRWAEFCKSGKHVLLLTYNLALTEWARGVNEAGRKNGRPSHGSIVVKSWEELIQNLFEHVGLPYELPSSQSEKSKFYMQTVPELVSDMLESVDLPKPAYDALIVDEGQDHDTSFIAGQETGYWDIYAKLLKNGSNSMMAVFCDPAQRPPYREDERFSLQLLKSKMGNQPVHVHLRKAVRYSRPIFEFLVGLDFPETEPFVKDYIRPTWMPEGPEVEQIDCPSEKCKQEAAFIISRWISDFKCKPEEILIVSAKRTLGRSVIGKNAKLCQYPVVDYMDKQQETISFISAQRAKGLDARAVILMDFPTRKELKGQKDLINYFMGASRARLMLAVIHTK